MNKLDELMALLQKQEKEEEKCKNTVMWVLAIIGAPDYLEDFEDDFDDDFDDYFEDEDNEEN